VSPREKRPLRREQWELLEYSRCRRDTSHKEEVNELETFKKNRRRHTVRLFGTNSLKEGAM
jgi:hypothetical protein